ncbi:hypothetical protein FN846DRAFT_38259 [Sphaerosporella brunnea]|uniref:Uncharacterized protein n=1 Tax=Sphaerosporella brunnea TaxID=1250544 RepID=A0A5J5FAN7_9PEZI|nr:hypothetical protein FN846DRAFT_38259 [Sphaerosporella brunnea]
MSAIVVYTADSSGNYSSISSRPIRPLPKRRLRSRLSSDADAALFTASPAPAPPLFYFPYNNYAGGDSTLSSNSNGGGGGHGGGGESTGGAMGDGLHDSSDEDDTSSASVSRGVGHSSTGNGVSGGATTSDPYEWTENTNNKKKRKIPTHTNPGGSTGAGSGGGGGGGTGGGGGGAGSPASGGFSPTSTPRIRWKSNSVSGSQRSPNVAVGAAGGGSANMRRHMRRYPSSPAVGSADKLHAFSTNTTTATASTSTSTTNSTAKAKEDPVTPVKGKRKGTGITASSSFADSSASGLPKQTQFTFTYKNPVMILQDPPSTPAASSGDNTTPTRSMQTVGTQTSPGMSNSPPPAAAKKKAPKPSRRELFAAAQRRRRQEALAHPNANGQIWICEFCEYESIFGEPPEALMRQYEIKDRKERRRIAEKRRLLEKAKQKGTSALAGEPRRMAAVARRIRHRLLPLCCCLRFGC